MRTESRQVVRPEEQRYPIGSQHGKMAGMRKYDMLFTTAHSFGTGPNLRSRPELVDRMYASLYLFRTEENLASFRDEEVSLAH